MNDEKEIDIILGKRLLQFRKTVGLPRRVIFEITGISISTLRRIENNSHEIQFGNIKKLSEAFGVTAIQFQDDNYPIPSRKALIKSLHSYIKKYNKEVDLNRELNRSNTALFLDRYIADSFLVEFKSMEQILDEIKSEYNVDLIGSQISKLLATRKTKGLIIQRSSSKKKNSFEYKTK